MGTASGAPRLNLGVLWVLICFLRALRCCWCNGNSSARAEDGRFLVCYVPLAATRAKYGIAAIERVHVRCETLVESLL